MLRDVSHVSTTPKSRESVDIGQESMSIGWSLSLFISGGDSPRITHPRATATLSVPPSSSRHPSVRRRRFISP